MTDTEFRELIKYQTIVDYKLTVIIDLLNQVFPEMKINGQTVTLKQILGTRLKGFLGPTQNAVTDQVMAEIRERAAQYKKHT